MKRTELGIVYTRVPIPFLELSDWTSKSLHLSSNNRQMGPMLCRP